MIFQYNDTPIHYTLQGKGETLVLLHGFLESSTIWNQFIEPLSKKYTVITLDLPGHGKSGIVAQTHTMELMATVVNSLLEFLNIEETIVLGHSMGGYVALAFSELFEEKLSKLILLNSTAEADSEERKENRNRAIQLIKKEKNTFLSMAISNLFSEDSRKQFSKEITNLKNEAYQFPIEGIIANILGMRDRKDRTIILKNLTKPKWILCGKEDPIVPLATSLHLAKKTKTSIEIFEGSHMTWLENDEEIIDFMYFVDKK